MLRRRTNPYVGRLLAAAILLAAGVLQAADDAVLVNAAGGSYAPFSMANGIEVAGGYTPDLRCARRTPRAMDAIRSGW